MKFNNVLATHTFSDCGGHGGHGGHVPGSLDLQNIVLEDIAPEDTFGLQDNLGAAGTLEVQHILDLQSKFDQLHSRALQGALGLQEGSTLYAHLCSAEGFSDAPHSF